jgi:hypothetical protein
MSDITTEQQMARAMRTALFEELGYMTLRRIDSFEERGLLTGNEGLVCTMTNGSEYQVTIVQSRPAYEAPEEVLLTLPGATVAMRPTSEACSVGGCEREVCLLEGCASYVLPAEDCCDGCRHYESDAEGSLNACRGCRREDRENPVDNFLSIREATVSDGSITVTLGEVLDELAAGDAGVAVEAFAAWFVRNYRAGSDAGLGYLCQEAPSAGRTIALFNLIDNQPES